MIKAIQDQMDAAKAAGKGKSQAGGQRAPTRRRKATKPITPEPAAEEVEEEEVEPLLQPDPTPRYYTSTSRTPNGLLMARLVGYSEAQLQEVYAFTQARHGARPY
ncbi:hypothetical protein D0N36_06845 [Hymenobacter lapidiphilus]|nr:hypothetical protein [Hymenobacter sp. CCM 8763]RFP65915.1 hypothetical protein D0N36_06845 [Hymenobacter sp. CCM 8763]